MPPFPQRARIAGLSRALRRALIGLLLALLVLAAPGVAQASPAAGGGGTPSAPGGGPVVMLGIPGLSADDITPEGTPNLHRLSRSSSVGNLAVRSATSATCAGDGWMTLSTGRRAQFVPPGTEFPTTVHCPTLLSPRGGQVEDEPVPAQVPGWAEQRATNLAGSFEAAPGVLGTALEAQGRDRLAVGPGAAIALADDEGTLPDYLPADAVLPSALPDLTVVDIGGIGSGVWVPESDMTTTRIGWDEDRLGLLDSRGAPAHEVQVAAADELVGQRLAQLPPEATVVVAGLGDAASPSRLRYLSITDDTLGYLGSPSTRRDDLSQLIDLGPIVTSLLGMEQPSEFQGSPARSTVVDDGERLTHLRTSAVEAATIHRSVQSFSVGADIAHYLLAAALGLLLWRRWKHPGWRDLASSPGLLRGFAWAGLVLASVLPAVFLAGLLPWSSTAQPELSLAGAVVAGTLAALGVTLAGPWRRSWAGRVAALSTLTAGTLAVDVATGSHLQFNSLLGYNAIVAGRFYGLSNQAVAIFIPAALIACALAARALLAHGRSRLAIALPIAVGLGSVVVLGNPGWGAKFGGTIATLVGFIVLVLMLRGIRLTIRRLALIGAISLITLVGIAGLDYLRPPEARSHFGMFFGQILSGEMLGVIGRKLSANLSIITTNPLIALVVPIGMLAIVLFLGWLKSSDRFGRLADGWAGRLPEVLEDRSVRAGFSATLLALLTGLVITDSGVAVPATGLMFLVPVLLCLQADLVESEEPRGIRLRDRLPDRVSRLRYGLAAGSMGLAASALGAAIVIAPPPAPDPLADDGQPVVVLGVSGLTWDDIDSRETPALYDLAERGGIAALTPRSVRTSSCPVDGWLALNSGRRAADEPRADCRSLGTPLDGQVPDWDVYTYRASQDNYQAPLGLLAAQTRAEPTAAFGPGAAVALADAQGYVESWSPVPAEPEDLGAQVGIAANEGGLVVVDLGNTETDGFSMDQLDARVAAVLESLRDAEALTIIASISDGGAESRMQVLAASGTGYGGAQLSSNSTRQPGLVQTTDLTPTVLEHLGVPLPHTLSGATLEQVQSSPTSGQERIQLLRDRDTAVTTQLALAQWFYPFHGILLLGLLALGMIGWRRHRETTAPLLRWTGLFMAAVPVSTYLANLIPWQRSSNPDVAMLGVVIGSALVIATLIEISPWRRTLIGPIIGLSAVTVAVLAIDVLTGSGLQMSTLMGEPLLDAARFYGIGNSAFALLSAALMIGLACAVAGMPKRRWRVFTILVTGTVVCVLLATPGLGTKFGSVPTLITGLAVLTLGAAGVRPTLRRMAAIGTGILVLMLAVLFFDWLRPPGSRTHFGRFFASILDGQAGAVIARKIGMNLDILTQNGLTLLLPVVIGLAFWAMLQPRRFRMPDLADCYARVPLLRTGVAAAVTLLSVGTVVNDSGIILPAVGLLFLVPALGHLVGQRARMEREGTLPEPQPIEAAVTARSEGDDVAAVDADESFRPETRS